VSLIARQLENKGIPAVIAGSAKDIIEHCGVPRFLFTDFPLGNSAGKPFDLESQDNTLELALQLLESARAPRTTIQSPQTWSSSHEWKLDFQNIERIPMDELKKRRQEFDKIKSIGQQVRDHSKDTQSD
jgi:hypothetical protein